MRMPVEVTIKDGEALYRPVHGTTLGWTTKNLLGFHVHSATEQLPLGGHWQKYHRTDALVDGKLPHSVPQRVSNVETIVRLTDPQFAAFKNGGKRRPTKPGNLGPDRTIQTGLQVTPAHRTNREKDSVREGDVGPYKAGDYHLGHSLEQAKRMPVTPLAHDVKRGVRHPDPPDAAKMNRDHMNNQRTLVERGEDPKYGLTMAIPQWVHKNGYTWGYKAKWDKHGGAVSRTEWAAANGGAALFKEFFQELRTYHEAGQLDCEVVGSYRYLYRLYVKASSQSFNNGMKNPEIDKLLLMYLHAAAHGQGADQTVPWI
jgi:hypothetical protein